MTSPSVQLCQNLHCKCRPGAHHPEFATHFVREVAENEHAEDLAGECQTGQGRAVVGCDLGGSIHTLEDYQNEPYQFLGAYCALYQWTRHERVFTVENMRLISS